MSDKKNTNDDMSSYRNHKSVIRYRLSFIFGLVVILTCVLVARMFYIQVVEHKRFKSIAIQKIERLESGKTQRGSIYDSQGQLLAGSSTKPAVIYNNTGNIFPDEMYRVANKLTNYISLNDRVLTKEQMANYILSDPKNILHYKEKIKNFDEKYSGPGAQSKLIQLVISNPPKLRYKIRNAAKIFTLMNSSYPYSSVYIKTNNLTARQIAIISEHEDEMHGITIGSNANRFYPSGKDVMDIIGTMSDSRTGLPSQKVNTLLAQGYDSDDSVGQSSLEQQYEPVLKGTKPKILNIINSKNKIIKSVKKYNGKIGDSVYLNINYRFEQQLQNIVWDACIESGRLSTGAYSVVMNPNNGKVIALAGVSRDPRTGKIKSDPLGTINKSMVMGSLVKGATVTGALMRHVISPTNNVLIDHPINLGGNLKKGSWFNHKGYQNIALNAQSALAVSSNSYMMQLALKEGGVTDGERNFLAKMNPDIFNILRNNFNQFGLGVLTGIDLPGEVSGLKGPTGFDNIAKSLDEAYGNYDTYTPIQIAQYMSTIANGGYRISPRIVDHIQSTNDDGSPGPVQTNVNAQVLNYINDTQSDKKVVTDGLYNVVHGSDHYATGKPLDSLKPKISAKTGTAETFTDGIPTTTLSVASYAPSNHPDVVIVINLPGSPVKNPIDDVEHTKTVKKIYNTYWNMVQSKSEAENK